MSAVQSLRDLAFTVLGEADERITGLVETAKLALIDVIAEGTQAVNKLLTSVVDVAFNFVGVFIAAAFGVADAAVTVVLGNPTEEGK
jgi:phage-related protein